MNKKREYPGEQAAVIASLERLNAIIDNAERYYKLHKFTANELDNRKREIAIFTVKHELEVLSKSYNVILKMYENALNDPAHANDILRSLSTQNVQTPGACATERVKSVGCMSLSMKKNN